MNGNMERIYNGIVKENPTFVMMLGMCPTLAVTTSVINGIGMGLSTTAVLVVSNLVISLLRKVIPDEVRLPAFIVIVASFVTVTELLMKAYLLDLYESLGVFIPLIVVNCIILGRAEAYASKNPPLLSIFDGLGMGIGFTLSLTAISFFRELLGAGTLCGVRVMPDFYQPIDMIVRAPGAFLILGLIALVMNALSIRTRANDMVNGEPCGMCPKDCAAKGGEECEKA